ncbi:MAG: rhomboid family intramembrane serine protease [Bacteroidetes bacterium]|nr:rhomboid family intramembrane serine protease [Bacteroidota bacterium]
MNREKQQFYRALIYPVVLVGIMVLVYTLEVFGDFHWDDYGLKPGNWIGLRGILFSPFLHASWEHLLSNAFPLLILGTALFYFFSGIAWELMFWQFLMNGLMLWFLGAEGTIHIGASGLVYSMAFFLLFSGFIRKNKGLTMLSFAVIMLYGYLIWGMFPVQPHVSWEGHLAGFLSGAVLAFFFRKEGPADDKKKVWDDSDLDGVEPYWEVDDAEDSDQVDEKAKPIQIHYTYRKSEDKK